MGTLLVLQEVEKEFSEALSFETKLPSSPAVILDFNQSYQKKLQGIKLKQWGEDGLSVLKVIALDYERLMRVLASQITPEQLAKVTSLSAEEQIQEDLRRIHDLLAQLELQLHGKPGRNLQEAFEEIKKDQGELGVVAAYLEKNEYPLFRLMSKVIVWASLSPEEVSECELSQVLQSLLEMGAFDTANALVYLQSRAS